MSLFKTEWTEGKIRIWQAEQEMGRDRWVLIHWVMGWGTTMFLISTAIALISGESDSHLKTHLVVGMILWPTSGLILGVSAWARKEHSYQKHVERRVY